MNCFYCRSQIQTIPYSCKFCGMKFCSKHRLPENHRCNFSLKFQKINLKYKDALEFQDRDLTIADIYYLVTTNEMEKSKAIELLKFYIENEEDIEIKLNCINFIKILELKRPEVFTLLEKLILSEEKPELKERAAKVIKNLYPFKSKNILEWFDKYTTQKDNGG